MKRFFDVNLKNIPDKNKIDAKFTLLFFCQNQILFR
jgi:hypothetical protein